MTEQELLDAFRAAASTRIQPGMLTPGAINWVERQIDLAAARGANSAQIPNESAARQVADKFFAAVLPLAATPGTQVAFGVATQPITPEALDHAVSTLAAAAFAIWPFTRM